MLAFKRDNRTNDEFIDDYPLQKSLPQPSSYEANYLQRCHNIQIMNGYECDDTYIFMRWKVKCSIQRSETKFLSPNEIVCNIARMKNFHHLFDVALTSDVRRSLLVAVVLSPMCCHTGKPFRRHRAWHPALSQYTDTRADLSPCFPLMWNVTIVSDSTGKSFPDFPHITANAQLLWW